MHTDPYFRYSSPASPSYLAIVLFWPWHVPARQIVTAGASDSFAAHFCHIQLSQDFNDPYHYRPCQNFRFFDPQWQPPIEVYSTKPASSCDGSSRIQIWRMNCPIGMLGSVWLTMHTQWKVYLHSQDMTSYIGPIVYYTSGRPSFLRVYS